MSINTIPYTGKVQNQHAPKHWQKTRINTNCLGKNTRGNAAGKSQTPKYNTSKLQSSSKWISNRSTPVVTPHNKSAQKSATKLPNRFMSDDASPCGNILEAISKQQTRRGYSTNKHMGPHSASAPAHTISYNVLFWKIINIMCYYIILVHIISYRIVSYRIISYHIRLYYIISCQGARTHNNY